MPHVIDTPQGGLLKYVLPCKEDNECVLLESEYKEKFPPIKLPKNQIKRLFLILGKIQIESL